MLENYQFHGVKGMRDVFPDEARCFGQIEKMARTIFDQYQLGEIRTPIVEQTVLFERGVGQGTDIVNKEMFYVPAKDQDAEGNEETSKKMVLRPEATASVVRAYVEHEVNKQAPGLQRYYYIGPMFRYERPQRGRFRQFTQIGVELIGLATAAVDAEAIVLLVTLMESYQVKNIEVQLNSVGCETCRPDYINLITDFAEVHKEKLCGDCKIRLDKNPLRLFDCKHKTCKAIMAEAPNIQEALCSDCKNHQQEVVDLLEKVGMVFRINSRLMRGLDYYSRTVFEVIASNLGSQNAVAAGGRYDHLIKELDGPDLPAIGWSIGVERLLEIIDQSFFKPVELDLFIVAPPEDRLFLFEKVKLLRDQGCSVGFDHEAKSIKALLKKANKLNVAYSLFVTQEDQNKVELKNMQTGDQTEMNWDDVHSFIRKKGC